MENTKPKNDLILVVSRKETDPSCTLSNEPVGLEIVGLYHDIAKAAAAINEHLVLRKKALEAFYEEKCRRTRREISDCISEIAGDPDPESRDILRNNISVLEGLEKAYRASMVPETLVVEDEEGDLCDVTSRDDQIDWTCVFEIEKMTVK